MQQFTFLRQWWALLVDHDFFVWSKKREKGVFFKPYVLVKLWYGLSLVSLFFEYVAVFFKYYTFKNIRTCNASSFVSRGECSEELSRIILLFRFYHPYYQETTIITYANHHPALEWTSFYESISSWALKCPSSDQVLRKIFSGRNRLGYSPIIAAVSDRRWLATVRWAVCWSAYRRQ